MSTEVSVVEGVLPTHIWDYESEAAEGHSVYKVRPSAGGVSSPWEVAASCLKHGWEHMCPQPDGQYDLMSWVRRLVSLCIKERTPSIAISQLKG